RDDPYPDLEAKAGALVEGLASGLESAGVRHAIERTGSLFSLFFTEGPVRDYEDARAADHARFAAFHRAMLERGVYLPPSGYEAWFLSTAHGDAEIERVVAAAAEAARLTA
ncbi:MAG TPA: aspartate aminotransferase family protein, partial [Actinomycetota bacterium]|nr:aspartate aminotransferase family protein [Actinomycetota bacterium]